MTQPLSHLCCWGECGERRWGYLLVCEDHARLIATHVSTTDAEAREEAARQDRAATRLKPHERRGWVYYLNVGGRLKIGFEKHFGSRLRAYPPGTEVLGRRQGTLADEQAEHQRCQPWRVAGREWYDINESTLRVVEEANAIEAAREAAARAARPVEPRPGLLHPAPPPLRRSPPPAAPPPSPEWIATWKAGMYRRTNNGL